MKYFCYALVWKYLGVVSWTIVCLVVIPTASEAPNKAIIIVPIIKDDDKPKNINKIPYNNVAYRTTIPLDFIFDVKKTKKLPNIPPKEFEAVSIVTAPAPPLKSFLANNGIICL